MRFAFLTLACLPAWAETFLRFDPAVVTHCAVPGLGSGTLAWSYDGPGPVQVRVGSPDGTPLTGPAQSQGSAPTGDWVTDGISFVLTLGGTQELARTTAVVRCNPAGEVLSPALSVATWFPLQVGD